jgi:hypothetical protein
MALAGRVSACLDPGDGGHRGMPTTTCRPVEHEVGPMRLGLPSVLGSGTGLTREALVAGVGRAGPIRLDPSTLGAAGVEGAGCEGHWPAHPGLGLVGDRTEAIKEASVSRSQRGCRVLPAREHRHPCRRAYIRPVLGMGP